MASCAPPVAPVINSKDSASKRKRANRLAKLKQFKLESRREQWLSHKVVERRQGQEILHAEVDPCVSDPGEVIHPDRAELKHLPPLNSTVSWASLVISSQMPKNVQRTHYRVPEPQNDPAPLAVNANPVNLRIKRSDQKESCRDASLGSVYDGYRDSDMSPKSCEDRSPKSKASKVGRDLRRSRGDLHLNSKENECLVTEHKLGLGEEGWEAAADALGLHTIEQKFSNVLQPQVVPCNDQQQHSRALTVPLLGLKPNKQLQNVSHGRAWMRGDLHRPASLPNPIKQRNSSMRPSTCTHTNGGTERLECLVCTEVLDSTDAAFPACTCGFKICLFCYHKISQETARCPGCRGVYKVDVSAKPTFLLPR